MVGEKLQQNGTSSSLFMLMIKRRKMTPVIPAYNEEELDEQQWMGDAAVLLSPREVQGTVP